MRHKIVYQNKYLKREYKVKSKKYLVKEVTLSNAILNGQISDY